MRELEIKDIGILNDPLLTDRLGYDDKLAIQTPANQYLSWCLLVPAEDYELKLALYLAATDFLAISTSVGSPSFFPLVTGE